MSANSKSKQIRSPLAKARGLGSARGGVEHWMHQRLTAIANIPLVCWMIFSVTQMRDFSYEEIVHFFQMPLNAILMILSLVSIFYHAALGSQVVIEDYVHHEGFKTVKLIGMKLFFFALAVASIFSVLKIALVAS